MTLTQLVSASRASQPFRDALTAFARSHSPNERVQYDPRACPPVKVERALTQLLATRPDLEIDRVEIQGESGCEYFRGSMRVVSSESELQVRFRWDCRWRAEQQGWRDAFGFPDQIRAAREFGFDCFRDWTEQEQRVEAVRVTA
jgi:hypothetical protein